MRCMAPLRRARRSFINASFKKKKKKSISRTRRSGVVYCTARMRRGAHQRVLQGIGGKRPWWAVVVTDKQ